MSVLFLRSKLAFAMMIGCITLHSGYVKAGYTFDAAMLKDRGKGVDITLFEEGGQLPGIYTVDVILNGTRVDTRELPFHLEDDIEGKPYLKACLTRNMLTRYGIKIEDYPEMFYSKTINKQGDNQDCADLKVIPKATEQFMFASQQLFLGIPQVALRPQFSDIAPEVLWDDGITAFLLNWQANANRTEQRGNGQSSGRDDFWLSLEPGLNIGASPIRNLSSWHKNAGKAGKWETVYTRAERGLNGIKSRLTVGESYTPSDIFDSVPFRGLMLASDENMVPYSHVNSLQ